MTITRKSSWLAALLAVSSFQARADTPNAACKDGWFSIEALVTAIVPSRTLVRKRNAGENVSVAVKAGDVLCEGQILMFPEPGKGGTVELFQGDKQILLEAARGEYELKGGLGASISEATQYFSNAVASVGSLKRPEPRPSATAGRGAGGDSGKADHIHLIQPLAKIGKRRQLAVVGAPVLLAWREGTGPYECVLLVDGKPVGPSHSTPESWCETSAVPAGADRVLVRDSGGQQAGLNLETIAVAELPRPSWVKSSAAMDSGPNETAWATWLWLEKPEAQLAALSMFNASRAEFMAGYIVEGILREDVPIQKP